MPLTLFRSTDFGPSELAPGEMRTHRHPGWIVAAVAAWIGLACNPALWQSAACACTAGLPRALALGLGMAALTGVVLSVLGRRKALKPVAALMLLGAAALAAGLWMQGQAMDPSMLRAPGTLLPAAAVWLDWRFDLVIAALTLLPLVWLMRQRPRRLTPVRQWAFSVYGVLLSAVLMALAAALL
jgi:glucan phosphoethanolaminetransferase (alkaline phosphatase superfamily)